MLITTIDRLVAYHTWTYETGVRPRLVDFSARAGRPITTLASILDLENVSTSVASSATRNYIQRASATDSAHYPETLGKMFIINAPGFFAAFWQLIKGFFDERTTRKIEIIANVREGREAGGRRGGRGVRQGRDALDPHQRRTCLPNPYHHHHPTLPHPHLPQPSAWRPRLKEVIGEANLPTEYGGTLKVESLYHVSRTRLMTLPAGKLFRDIVVLPKGCTVRFKWYSKPGDVRFSVAFYPGAPPASLTSGGAGVTQPEPVRFTRAPSDAADAAAALAAAPLAAVRAEVHAAQDHANSDKQPVIVQHLTPADGFYVLTWDNTKAWFQREVYHR